MENVLIKYLNRKKFKLVEKDGVLYLFDIKNPDDILIKCYKNFVSGQIKFSFLHELTIFFNYDSKTILNDIKTWLISDMEIYCQKLEIVREILID